MTVQEAIETIKYASAFNREDSPLTVALDMAVEALEKQIKLEEVVARLEEEMKLAEKDMEECTFKGMPFYDRANGYATAMYNAIEIVKEGMC